MKKIKLIASDLDGTLLNSDSQVSLENLSAIKKLTEKGVHFVLCTGRTFAEIPEELKNSPYIRYSIYSNGSVVYDKVTGQRILTGVPNAFLHGILDTVYSYETHVTLRYNGVTYVDKNYQSEYYFDFYNLCEAHKHVVRNFAVYLDNFTDFCYSLEDVEVVSVFFRNYEDKIKCREYLEKNSELRVVEVDKYNLEIVNADAGKGKALIALAKKLNIDISETMSIGDSDNDRTSIEAAGLGLAVSNSTEDLKKVADEIICSNDEHVALYVLSNYFS